VRFYRPGLCVIGVVVDSELGNEDDVNPSAVAASFKRPENEKGGQMKCATLL